MRFFMGIKVWMIIVTIISLLSFVPSVISLYLYNTGEWVCIATTCTEWVTGEDWVVKNCRPNDAQTDMVCKIDTQKESYLVLLSKIDSNNFKSCAKETCAASVYVKPNTEVIK